MTKARTLADNYAADINQITASAPLTGGGTSGTVTVGIQDGTTSQKGAVQLEDSTASTSTTKASTPNSVKSAYDLANGAIAKSTIDAKGDLLVGTANDTVSRLAVASTAGYLLSVDSAEATGLKWAAPAAGSGLTLISNTSFDSTGYAIDSVFSTTYELYLIEWYAYQQNVVNQTASFRFRNTSGDITSGYYGSCFGYNTGGTLSTISTSNASAWTLPEGDAYTGSKFSMVFNRNTNHLSGTMITTTYDDNKRIFTGGCVVAGTITGMKLQYGGSGSYGKLAIYGMAKA